MLPPNPSGEPMCDQCVELQRRIDQFSRFISQPLNPLTIERMKAARSGLELQKIDMHAAVRLKE
jgi:hypothetical protein